MAKDPAVLFYTNDFLSGTFTMSNEQVGKYIRLLCLQHQKGSLTDNDMKNICKTYDVDIYSHFIKDGDIYYNPRMREEAEKRKKYSESRKNNRNSTKDKNTSNTYVKHMETETETINEDIDKEQEQEVSEPDTSSNISDEVTKLFIKRWSRNYKNFSELQGAEKLVLEFGIDKVNNAFRIAGEAGKDKDTIPYVRGILNKEKQNGVPKKRFGNSDIMNELYGQ